MANCKLRFRAAGTCWLLAAALCLLLAGGCATRQGKGPEVSTPSFVLPDGTCWLYSEQTVFGEGVRPHVECIFSEVTDLQRQRQELLRQCGFRYFTTFEGGKPRFRKL